MTYDPIERWEAIPGTNGRYCVSDIGRVWSNVSGKQLKTRILNGKYRVANISPEVGMVQSNAKVHRLVLLSFRGSGREDQIAMHLAGDSLNNCLSNLQWGTQKENIQMSVAQGTNAQLNKVRCPQGHKYDTLNTQYVTNAQGNKTRRCGTCNRIRVAEFRSKNDF